MKKSYIKQKSDNLFPEPPLFLTKYHLCHFPAIPLSPTLPFSNQPPFHGVSRAIPFNPSTTSSPRRSLMKTLKSLFIATLLFFLTGCWFIFIPIGPIVRAIQGPRYCVAQFQSYEGARIQTPSGRWATVKKVHGENSACINPSHPVLVNVEFDEVLQP